MIGYVTIGTNHFDRALEFYDALLGELGVERLWTTDDLAAWGPSRSETSLCVGKPFDGNQGTIGNGVMIALKADTREQVDAVHAMALTLGGSDEGVPGPRGSTGFYGGYFRDLDGNKLNAYIPGGA